MKQPVNRYSRKAYEMLHVMQEGDCVSRTWVAQIKFLLCFNGFGYVCMYGCVGNEKMIVHNKISVPIKKLLLPEVVLSLAKSERFDLYSFFKKILERERYLEFIQSRVYKIALARFRVGVSRINDHRLRFSVADNNDSALFV